MSSSDRIEEIEKDLHALIDAHRELHARHEAVSILYMMLFTLINASPALKQQRTTRAYDLLNDVMEAKNYDEEFQVMARNSMDELVKMVLKGA